MQREFVNRVYLVGYGREQERKRRKRRRQNEGDGRYVRERERQQPPFPKRDWKKENTGWRRGKVCLPWHKVTGQARCRS